MLRLLPVAAIVIITFAASRNHRSDNVGVVDGALRPCPSSPNCVSSTATDSAHAIDPFPIFESGEKSITRLAGIIATLPRTRIITQTERYLHAEFTSALFRFTDDLELLADENVVHVRSASRLGYGDFGANRKRVEKLRALYTK